MTKLIAPLFLLATLLVSTGCPVGIDYPLGTPGSEKIDPDLIGTWSADKEDHEIMKVRIEKADNYSYRIVVLETGSMYSVEDDQFTGRVTTIGGKKFIYAQPNSSSEYYTYCYELDGKEQMRSYDVGLLVGGTDAVTSTQAYRNEVEASLKMDDCLSEETLWIKE